MHPRQTRHTHAHAPAPPTAKLRKSDANASQPCLASSSDCCKPGPLSPLHLPVKSARAPAVLTSMKHVHRLVPHQLACIVPHETSNRPLLRHTCDAGKRAPLRLLMWRQRWWRRGGTCHRAPQTRCLGTTASASLLRSLQMHSPWLAAGHGRPARRRCTRRALLCARSSE